MIYEYDQAHLALKEAIGSEYGATAQAARRFEVTYRHMQRVLNGGYPDTAISMLQKLGYLVRVEVSAQSPEESA